MTINIYLNQIDKFIKRAHKNGYISKRTHIKEIRDKRDKKLWNKITSTEDNALLEQLPEKRSRLLRPRGHEYELPLVRTERFKRSFINRCLYTNCVYFHANSYTVQHMIWHETVESSNSIEIELNFRVQTAARLTSKVISVNILRIF